MPHPRPVWRWATTTQKTEDLQMVDSNQVAGAAGAENADFDGNTSDSQNSKGNEKLDTDVHPDQSLLSLDWKLRGIKSVLGLFGMHKDKYPPTRNGNGVEVTAEDFYHLTGFTFPSWKKWWILTVIFIVQVSMNFNAGVYGNAVTPMSQYFSISEQAARVGQMIFLICYAFGCELWAPWSEEFGRWRILQLSLGLVNIWQLPAALAPNFGTIVVARALGGLSSAGGSVTLGMVADMWEPDDQQYAVNFVVFSSVGGSVVGPIVGAFAQNFLDWRWVFWLQLIFGGAVQILHFFTVCETRTSIMLDEVARELRKKGNKNACGPNELKAKRIEAREVLTIWSRPFIFFVREPIVLCLSLLSGFSDALIFTFLESFGPVYKQWGFTTITIGLAFVPILIGYIIAYVSFFPWIRRDIAARKRDYTSVSPERRLYWLLYLAPLETIGLFGFAWTSTGPPLPWIASMIFSACIGIANFAIYMATVDYMIAAYGPFSASATGGNGFARDFLAGIAALYATPLYTNIGSQPLAYGSTILGCLAFCVTIPIYVFYWKGLWFRDRSKFAQTLAHESVQKRERRSSRVNSTTIGDEKL